jgi:tetratricopeptide (TPR) repeat protein
LLGLNRGLARIPDKALIRRLVNQLTEPYLDRPEAHFARANAAYVAGDPEGASTAIEGALALRPDWEQAVILRAQLRQEQSPGAGVGILRDYLAAHPEAREPRLTLARLLVAGRQFGPAREQFELLLQRSPDDRDVVHAVALLSMQQGDWALAETHFKRLLELGHPEPDTLRMYLGQIADQAKRPDDAIAWYKAVRGASPSCLPRAAGWPRHVSICRRRPAKRRPSGPSTRSSNPSCCVTAIATRTPSMCSTRRCAPSRRTPSCCTKPR